MKLETLTDLYVDLLKDLYDAENKIVKALPKLAKAASSAELQQGFEQHLEESKGHIERLDQVFQHLGEPAKRKKCKAIEGLLEEGKELMEAESDSEVLDAGLIAAAQKVEHYEIASYGCARTYAELLGQNESAALLEQTLEEEKQTDRKLSELATSQINIDAKDAETEQKESIARRRPAARAKAQGKR
jgi:ferritin-like metal-binding protein YciE